MLCEDVYVVRVLPVLLLRIPPHGLTLAPQEKSRRQCVLTVPSLQYMTQTISMKYICPALNQ